MGDVVNIRHSVGDVANIRHLLGDGVNIRHLVGVVNSRHLLSDMVL